MTLTNVLDRVKPYVLEGFLLIGVGQWAEHSGVWNTGLILSTGDEAPHIHLSLSAGGSKEDVSEDYEKLKYFWEGMSVERIQKKIQYETEKILNE